MKNHSNTCFRCKPSKYFKNTGLYLIHLREVHHAWSIPAGSPCIDKEPTKQSILFGDQFIRLRWIARETGLSVAYISYIFSGKRSLSMRAARLISAAMHIELGKFVMILDEMLKYKAIYSPHPGRKPSPQIPQPVEIPVEIPVQN